MKRRPVILAIWAMLFSAGLPGGRATAQVDDVAIKAAYIYNFSKFVEWPADAFSGDPSIFSLCVLGDREFGALVTSLRGETIGPRKINVIDLKPTADAKACHALYISASEKWRIESVLAHVSGLPILTISDSDDFLDQGGIIRMYVEDGKLRFKVRITAAERAGLVLSSKLLKLATIVEQ